MEEKVITYNRKAMFNLHNGNYELSLQYLKKAQKLLKGIPISLCSKLMGITLNNLGCYHKSINQPNQALVYIKQAVELERNFQNNVNGLAASFLNLCAVESQLGNHLKALDHCLEAIHILKNVYNNSEKNSLTYVAAHYNAGLQYKFLLKYPQSKKILEIALDLSKELLGISHFLTKNIEETLELYHSYEFNNRGHSLNLTPIKSIRSSTAATSIKRKINKKYGTSNETLNFSIRKMAKGRIHSPSYVKKFREKLENSHQTGISICEKNISTKKSSKKTKNIFQVTASSDISISASPFLKKIVFKDIRKLSAIMIQKTWKMYITRKKYKMQNLEMQISIAEEKAKNALKKLESLKSKKFAQQGSESFRFALKNDSKNELIPVPFKSKFTNSERTEKVNKKNVKYGNERHSQSKNILLLNKIVKIQACLRKFIQSKKFKNIKKLVIQIQKHWKGYFSKKKYHKMREAILKIQKFYRKKYNLMKKRLSSSNFSVFGKIYQGIFI